jgi:hypothetical protein
MRRRLIEERQAILGLMGLPFLILGIAILMRGGEDWQQLDPSVEYIANRLFGWLWVVSGSFAIAAMLIGKRNSIFEEVGYGFLFLPPFVWMSAYLVTLIYGGGFLVFVGFLVASTVVVLVVFLARYMRNW